MDNKAIRANPAFDTLKPGEKVTLNGHTHVVIATPVVWSRSEDFALPAGKYVLEAGPFGEGTTVRRGYGGPTKANPSNLWVDVWVQNRTFSLRAKDYLTN